MAIKRQQQDDKHPYASPTTPGLYVTLRAYIIELICLNVDKKIGSRFWSDKKYWGPKFRREIKGVDNVWKQLEEIDILTETAFIQIIKDHNIKSLTYKATANRVVKSIVKRKMDLEQQRVQLRKKMQHEDIDSKKNSTFVDTGKKGAMARVREIEDG